MLLRSIIILERFISQKIEVLPKRNESEKEQERGGKDRGRKRQRQIIQSLCNPLKGANCLLLGGITRH